MIDGLWAPGTSKAFMNAVVRSRWEPLRHLFATQPSWTLADFCNTGRPPSSFDSDLDRDVEYAQKLFEAVPRGTWRGENEALTDLHGTHIPRVQTCLQQTLLIGSMGLSPVLLVRRTYSRSISAASLIAI